MLTTRALGFSLRPIFIVAQQVRSRLAFPCLGPQHAREGARRTSDQERISTEKPETRRQFNTHEAILEFHLSVDCVATLISSCFRQGRHDQTWYFNLAYPNPAESKQQPWLFAGIAP